MKLQSFCRISNLSYYLNKNELRKNCYENHYVKGMTPDLCFLVFAQVRDHTRRFYGNCASESCGSTN